MCDCKKSTNGVMNDYYSKATANTGVSTVSVGNPLLNGGGQTATVLVAAQSGTFIKSVRIKATEPITQGMIRLFIANAIGAPVALVSLFKEVVIPSTPLLLNTPTPAPVLAMYEMLLAGGIKLEKGYRLIASTQNSQSFNIIVEGIDWEYPATTPTECCNFRQEIAVTGLGTVNTANTALDGSGATVTIFTAPPNNGSIVKSFTLKAMQSTSMNGMVRLFIDNGVKKFLYKEISIPETVQSSIEPSFKIVIDDDFYLRPGFSICASTQLEESFAVTVEAINWAYA